MTDLETNTNLVSSERWLQIEPTNRAGRKSVSSGGRERSYASGLTLLHDPASEIIEGLSCWCGEKFSFLRFLSRKLSVARCAGFPDSIDAHVFELREARRRLREFLFRFVQFRNDSVIEWLQIHQLSHPEDRESPHVCAVVLDRFFNTRVDPGDEFVMRLRGLFHSLVRLRIDWLFLHVFELAPEFREFRFRRLGSFRESLRRCGLPVGNVLLHVFLRGLDCFRFQELRLLDLRNARLDDPDESLILQSLENLRPFNHLRASVSLDFFDDFVRVNIRGLPELVVNEFPRLLDRLVKFLELRICVDVEFRTPLPQI